MKHVIVSTIAIQKVIIYQHNASIIMMAFFIFGSKEKIIWKFD